MGAVIVIPPDFAREFRRGRGAIVSILADASDPTVSRAIALSAQGFAQSLRLRMHGFSDVPGDNPANIASGPTEADPTSCADALEIVAGRIATIDAHGTTHMPGVWAGGDCVVGGDDLTVSAVQHGKLAAVDIDRRLREG